MGQLAARWAVSTISAPEPEDFVSGRIIQTISELIGLECSSSSALFRLSAQLIAHSLCAMANCALVPRGHIRRVPDDAIVRTI